MHANSIVCDECSLHQNFIIFFTSVRTFVLNTSARPCTKHYRTCKQHDGCECVSRLPAHRIQNGIWQRSQSNHFGQTQQQFKRSAPNSHLLIPQIARTSGFSCGRLSHVCVVASVRVRSPSPCSHHNATADAYPACPRFTVLFILISWQLRLKACCRSTRSTRPSGRQEGGCQIIQTLPISWLCRCCFSQPLLVCCFISSGCV